MTIAECGHRAVKGSRHCADLICPNYIGAQPGSGSSDSESAS